MLTNRTPEGLVSKTFTSTNDVSCVQQISSHEIKTRMGNFINTVAGNSLAIHGMCDKMTSMILAMEEIYEKLEQSKKLISATKGIVMMSRFVERRITPRRLYADVMDGSVPHTAAGFLLALLGDVLFLLFAWRCLKSYRRNISCCTVEEYF